MSRKIAVLTSTRADYGILRKLILLLKLAPEFDLDLIVTGTHLSKKHGNTVEEILSDGIEINTVIDINIDESTTKGIAYTVGISIQKCEQHFAKKKPDLLIILGDRFETLGFVFAASLFQIPIAHIHGGELTEGLIDDALRHSYTKFAHLHFVATNTYKKRVIQLGEMEDRIFNVGGLGVDAINSLKLLTKKQIADELGIIIGDSLIVATYHPLTLGKDRGLMEFQMLLKSLEKFLTNTIIFTFPNADPGSDDFFKFLNEFVNKNSNVHIFSSLGQLKYFSLLSSSNIMVGNSSSGLLEAPTFKLPVVNIGERQRGRVAASNVISVNPEYADIVAAIQKGLSSDFRASIKNCVNPYGDGGAAEKILNILKKTNFDDLLIKSFKDLP